MGAEIVMCMFTAQFIFTLHLLAGKKYMYKVSTSDRLERIN